VVCALLHRQTRQIGARIAYWVVIGMLAYGLANSQGRTGAIVVLVLLPLIVSCLLPARGLGIVLAGCVVGAAALLTNPIVQIRIDGFRQDIAAWRAGQTQSALGYRLEMWQTAAHVLGEHPVVGGGPRAFQREWKRRFPEPGVREHFAEPHNAYLFYAAAYGIPGLAALLLLFAANLVRGWRHRDVLAGSLTFAFAVVCILGSLTNTMLLGTTSALMVMLFIGLQGNLLHPATLAARRLPAGSA
jgi:O-antigen ligase